MILQASVARKIYLRQNVGVGRLRKIYGGKQRNGARPPHKAIASGAVIAAALKNLESMGVIETAKAPVGYIDLLCCFNYCNRGRTITRTGRRDLDRIAGQILFPKTKTPKTPATKP